MGRCIYAIFESESVGVGRNNTIQAGREGYAEDSKDGLAADLVEFTPSDESPHVFSRRGPFTRSRFARATQTRRRIRIDSTAKNLEDPRNSINWSVKSIKIGNIGRYLTPNEKRVVVRELRC